MWGACDSLTAGALLRAPSMNRLETLLWLVYQVDAAAAAAAAGVAGTATVICAAVSIAMQCKIWKISLLATLHRTRMCFFLLYVGWWLCVAHRIPSVGFFFSDW